MWCCWSVPVHLREVKHWLEHSSKHFSGEAMKNVLEYFREHNYQMSLLWKTEKKPCTEVRSMQTTLCKTQFQKSRMPTSHLLPAHQKCDRKIGGLCSFSFLMFCHGPGHVCRRKVTCIVHFGLRRFISAVFITAYEHDRTTPPPSSSDMQHDFLVAPWGTFYLSVVNSLIWPRVHFFSLCSALL